MNFKRLMKVKDSSGYTWTLYRYKTHFNKETRDWEIDDEIKVANSIDYDYVYNDKALLNLLKKYNIALKDWDLSHVNIHNEGDYIEVFHVDPANVRFMKPIAVLIRDGSSMAY